MRIVKIAAVVLVLILAGAQFMQPERTNPPVDPSASFEAVVKPPQHAAQTLHRACADCHSNQTEWPWYSRVSPVSWMIAGDVKEGRAHLNLSQWNLYGEEMSKLRMRAMCEEVKQGEMPPKYYLPMHPSAKLNAADVSSLCSLGGS